MATIITIVPYKFLPPVNGGHWGVIIVEKTLAVFNKVHTLSTDNNEKGKAYPFELYPVFTSGKSRYLPYSQLAKAYAVASRLQPDYIFCHHHYMYPMAKRLAARLGVPLYIRCHNIEAERFRSTGKWWWRVMRFLERRAFQKSDGVFFVTQEDRDWAIKHYHLDNDKAVVMPFGIDFKSTPALQADKAALARQYNLRQDVPWLFFMGQLDYGPNEQAVQFIIRNIFPLLKEKLPSFHILLCGKRLSETLQQEIRSVASDNNICYLGFVPEIEPVIAACDVMINPVVAGGGVKTKVVESLAWNKTVVSAYSGAIGIEQAVCGEKLLVAPDGDWQAFTGLIGKALAQPEAHIPKAYFDYYYAGHIAERLQPFFRAGKGN